MGDSVDVPGGMHGTVKFIGEVSGRTGTFAGVQLATEYAARGKNSGDVDGKTYFRTTRPGSGIFLPLEKAVRRSGPQTPTTPSLATFNQGGRTPAFSKLSQSVGPGARAASPALKPSLRRPSFQRPGSPLRQTPAKLVAPKTRPSMSPSKSQMRRPQHGPSPALRPSKLGLSFSATTDTLSRTRLGPESAFDEEPGELTPTPTPLVVPKSNNDTAQKDEIERLRARLEEREVQLRDQASSLTDMEKTLTELQSLLPGEDEPSKRLRDHGDAEDVVQLRAILREKNEKIQTMAAEFDAHRADFRSTIDTLEMASTETERVYEEKVDELVKEKHGHEKKMDALMEEVRELRVRKEHEDDFESVVQQLKQLEELVQELEEGLEDSRRGEAEAREEVEFLRGEVERAKSELRIEKERNAAALQRVSTSEHSHNQRDSLRDIEQRDDEIRGLKAIIHSLNRDSLVPNRASMAATNGHANRHSGGVEDGQALKLERQIKEMQTLVENKMHREEELEREIEHLRSAASTSSTTDKHKSSGPHLSDRTLTAAERRNRQNGGVPAPILATMHEADAPSSEIEGSTLWCEICETSGHEILTCNVFGRQASAPKESKSPASLRTGKDVVTEGLKGLVSPPWTNGKYDEGTLAPSAPRTARDPPIEVPKTYQPPQQKPLERDGMVGGKETGLIDETKWCALCEKDGHESVDCPFEEGF